MISISHPSRPGSPPSCPAGKTPGACSTDSPTTPRYWPPPDTHRDTYRIQELLRTYLTADLHRQGPTRAAELHATAAHCGPAK